MREQKSSLLWPFLLVVLLLHAWIWNLPVPHGIPGTESGLLSKRADKEPIEIERFDDKTQKPVVHTSKAPKESSDKNKTARFAGEIRQRVDKETQASAHGRFKEGAEAHRGKGGARGEGGTGGKPLAETDEEPDEDGATVGDGKKRGGLGMSDLLAFGANPHQLPKDIAEGNSTILNTDPVLYASFINRIADEIYDPWVGFAREAVRGLYLTGKKMEPNTYVTKLSISMNSEGKIDSMIVLKSSGIAELDEAPKKAFKEIEPFRNPPSQMFDKDGQVRFVYEFHFEWQTSSFNILPWQI